MAGYYTPMMGNQPTQLPTLTSYMHQRRLPAPYGYPDGSGDVNPSMQFPPLPPPTSVKPPPQTNPPPQQTPPTPQVAPPTGGQVQGTAQQGQQYSGGYYIPKPPQGTTEQGAYRPIQFPGVKESGNGRATFEDNSYVDYGSGAWQRAQHYAPPAAYSDLWQALPDSWKADLAGRDPAFVEKYLAAVANGNNAQAQDIYKQSTDYMNQQNQAAKQPVQRAQTDYRNAPYYVPTR